MLGLLLDYKNLTDVVMQFIKLLPVLNWLIRRKKPTKQKLARWRKRTILWGLYKDEMEEYK